MVHPKVDTLNNFSVIITNSCIVELKEPKKVVERVEPCETADEPKHEWKGNTISNRWIQNSAWSHNRHKFAIIYSFWGRGYWHCFSGFRWADSGGYVIDLATPTVRRRLRKMREGFLRRRISQDNEMINILVLDVRKKKGVRWKQPKRSNMWQRSPWFSSAGSEPSQKRVETRRALSSSALRHTDRQGHSGSILFRFRGGHNTKR